MLLLLQIINLQFVLLPTVEEGKLRVLPPFLRPSESPELQREVILRDKSTAMSCESLKCGVCCCKNNKQEQTIQLSSCWWNEAYIAAVQLLLKQILHATKIKLFCYRQY